MRRETVERRSAVAVTGIGVVSAIGSGADAFSAALAEGRSGIAPWQRSGDYAELPHVAAAVGEIADRELIRSPQRRRMDRLSRMAVAASRLALDDAGIDASAYAPDRAGIVFGTALGDPENAASYIHRVFTRGPAAASPMVFPNLVLNAPAGYMAMELGWTGVNLSVAQGEISGEHAVALGCDIVRSGRAELVLAGGGDLLAPIVADVYRRLDALAGQRGGREWASPYDVNRSGIVLGEGAALLVLEPIAQARARGAAVYALIQDTRSFAVAAPRFDWPACADAAVAPLRELLDGAHVDLICGSANSSRRLDRCELDLFARAVEPSRTEAYATSIKGAVGEFGAAGALTIAAACLALRAQTIPPLCHLEQPEHTAHLRLATGRAIPHSFGHVLACGLARGGAGTALLLSAAG
jgi:3-oxoacyl-[acyl-carrier-protein] synthase II